MARYEITLYIKKESNLVQEHHHKWDKRIVVVEAGNYANALVKVGQTYHEWVIINICSVVKMQKQGKWLFTNTHGNR